jgi:signal transduction histidine kinase/ligand-binding sensor domain-containing protein/CheY-like chemotaxis protein
LFFIDLNMKSITKTILSAFFFILALHLPAQQFTIHEFSAELAQPYVYSIVQDNNGFLWIGTGNGLSRFDGLNFKTYTVNDSLADNFITCSFKSGNDIWFGHHNGKISRYNGKEFTSIVPIKNASAVTDIEKRPNGEIWASTYIDGLVRLDTNSNSSLGINKKNQFNITSFKFINNDQLIAGSVNGLCLYFLLPSGEVKFIRKIKEIPESKIQEVTKMKDSSGFYIVTENEGIYQLFIDNYQFIDFPVGANLKIEFAGAQSVFEDDNSNLWISTFSKGLIKLTPSPSGQFTEATYFNAETGFSSNHAKTVYQDREGNIWIGNYGSGLTQLTDKLFSLYSFDDSLYGTSVYSVFAGQKYCWIGTDKGLIKMDQSTGAVIKFYSAVFGSKQNKITALYSGNENELWIGTEKNGFFRMIIDNEHITSFATDKRSLENSINFITGKKDQLWIGTKKGLCNIDLISNKSQWFTIDKGGLPHNYINHIFIDSKDRAWITSLSNVLVYIQHNEINKIVIPSTKGIISLSAITEENDSTIWVGSDGGGIFRIKSDSISVLTTEDGLLSNYCYSVVSDQNHDIWVGHRGGLSKIRTKDYFIRPIQQYAGIKSNCEFNTNAVYKDTRNRIWFGSDQGVWVYNPDLEKHQLTPPVLNITSVKANDEPVEFQKKIVFKPGNYKIKIEYLGINLKEPALVQYKYQLKGFDQSVETTKSTSITFPNLTDGKYSFSLWAYSGDGVMTTNPVTIDIIIKTPLWKQWWFYLIVFILVALYLVAYIKRRDQKHLIEKRILEEKVQQRTKELAQKNALLNKKQEEISAQNLELEKYRNYLEDIVRQRTKELIEAKDRAEESDKLKTAFLNNMSHEIRTPLNAICGFSALLLREGFSLEEKATFARTVTNNADSLLYLMDEILDMSLIETGQFVLTNEKFNVNKALIELENHYKFNEKEKLEFEYVNKNQDPDFVLFYDKKRFKHVFVNLLNNAFKFTESGYIRFGYKIVEKSVHFFVSDSGIGITDSQIDKIYDPFYKVENNASKLYRGAGIGLTTYRKIIEMMGGEIWVDSSLEKGSTFYFTLPLITENQALNDSGKMKSFKKDFLKKSTVLITEDDQINYELIRKILNQYGAKIFWAKNGQEAIEFVKENPGIANCIILMDIIMPVIDGYEANRQIKEINDQIPVIALTGFTMMNDKQKILNEKFIDFISKPIKTEDLLEALAKVLDKKNEY